CEQGGVVYTSDSNSSNNVNNTNNANNSNNITNEICDDGIDNDNDGYTDCQDLECFGDPSCQSTNNNNTNNNNNNNDAGPDGDGNIEPDIDSEVCPPEERIPCDTPVDLQCQSEEVANNGLDDNCNGQIDEVGGNVCVPGDVRQCFKGPPGSAGVGACRYGEQICLQTSGEFGEWGPCEGGIWPSPEICDDLDNDCNGCIDDGLCCTPPIECPSGDDPTLQGAHPFSDFVIDGSNYFTGTAYRWEWTVSTGPCDDVLGVRSYTINGHNDLNYVADTESIVLNFSLSGEYTVTMRVYYTPTEYYECTFIIKVSGPGLRVETCWDNHSITDLDLHLMKHGLGTNFCSDQDCFYSNCKAVNWDHDDWNIPDSDISLCQETESGDDWVNLFGLCKNPRLDLDNIFDNHGITPENINVDNPADGEMYRIALDYYYGTAAEIHPVVNIYCGGKRVATFGYPLSNQVTMTDDGGMGCSTGQLWRVADVEIDTDPNTGEIICNVDSLSDGSGNPNITNGDSSF
ncbi:MAG: hypothetical protein ACQES9_11925, partial [Myxococcota bacterium]